MGLFGTHVGLFRTPVFKRQIKTYHSENQTGILATYALCTLSISAINFTVKYYSGVFENVLQTTCKMLIFVPLKIVCNYVEKSPLQLLCIWRTCTVRRRMMCEKLRENKPCTQA